MDATKSMKFVCMTHTICTSFWYKLVDLKLNEDKLEEVTRHLWGYYEYPKDIPIIYLTASSFNSNCEYNEQCGIAHGYCITVNTEEKFQNVDKTELLADFGQKLMNKINNEEAVEDPSYLMSFILLIYADLKTYQFKYWIGYPTALDMYYYIENKQLQNYISADIYEELYGKHKQLHHNQRGFFGFQILNENNGVEIFTIKDFLREPTTYSPETSFLCYIDPSAFKYRCPSWGLRNLLMLIKMKYPDVFKRKFKVVSLRGYHQNWKSLSDVYILGNLENNTNVLKFIGWEKYSEKNKCCEFKVDLRDELDPIKRASEALDLNLKLMKWRLQPDLNIEILKNTSCLIIGAGTLGCAISRTLIGWGIEKFTFIDCADLKLSNLTRQCLYTSDQLSSGNVCKADAACEALKRIYPPAVVKGVNLEIPQCGRHCYSQDKNLKDLHELVKCHDVIFLLTDTRESRWLPTLYCAVEKKIAICVAVGYESFVVIRHGIKNENKKTKLGCYFCNDVVVPKQSFDFKELDLKCTLSRPGLSPIASGLAAEMLVALLHHPEKGEAEGNAVSCMGKIPHSIRGFMSDYEFMYPSTLAFDRCVACSDIVIDTYLREGDKFVQEVIKDEKHLKNILSLDEYFDVDDNVNFPESDCEIE